MRHLEIQVVLDHEQLHFDIDQLMVRRIKSKISELASGKSLDKHLLRMTIHKVISDFNTLQYQYDKETHHGRKKRKQRLWRKKINQLF